MQRILIVGPCGAGKSTLAFDLAERTGLPLYHMDRLNWRPGWTEVGDDALREALREIVNGPRWIIEGTYGATLDVRLERADTVLYLDYPIPLCVWRVLRRIVAWRGRSRPDMSDGCPERLDPEFLLYIARWNHGPRQRLEGRLKGHESKIVTLPTPAAARRWLAAVSGEPEQ